MEADLSYREISNNVTYIRGKIIGSSDSSGAITFEGRMNGNLPVAVKRNQLVDIKTKNLPKFEDDYIKGKLEHSNILRYFQCKTDEDFLYITMELCTGTLEDYIKGKRKEYTIMDNEKDILLQATEGLNYLHENGIFHGNIKPTNILFIFSTSSSATHDNKPTVKLGDYCIRTTLMVEKEQKDLFVPLNMEKIISKKNSPSTVTFGSSMNSAFLFSPDSVQQHGNVDSHLKTDIFAMGLVFFYTLTEGKHPFGEIPLEQFNGNQNKDHSIDSKSPYFEVGNRVISEFISNMCNMNPKERPTVQAVLSFVKEYSSGVKSDIQTTSQKTDGKKNKLKNKSGCLSTSQEGINTSSSKGVLFQRSQLKDSKAIVESTKSLSVNDNRAKTKKENPILRAYTALFSQITKEH